MSDFAKTIGILASIATCIAAIALVPAFGQWLSPRVPAPVITTDILVPTTTNISISSATIPPPAIPQSMVAVTVGVTNQTEFGLDDAKNYGVTASVINVDEAMTELSKYFSSNDIVYVVHVPNLRVTPGNPGSCKLYLNQILRLREYPLGWIIGGENIIPNHFKSNLSFCY